jgi:hypothetical protein
VELRGWGDLEWFGPVDRFELRPVQGAGRGPVVVADERDGGGAGLVIDVVDGADVVAVAEVARFTVELRVGGPRWVSLCDGFGPVERAGL